MTLNKCIDDINLKLSYNPFSLNAQIAQSVEQRIENPCVGGSIPPLGTIIYKSQKFLFKIKRTIGIIYDNN